MKLKENFEGALGGLLIFKYGANSISVPPAELLPKGIAYLQNKIVASVSLSVHLLFLSLLFFDDFCQK